MQMPFTKSDTHRAFENHLQQVCQKIDSLDNQKVLNASITELEQQFVDEATINALEVQFAEHHIEDQRAVSIDVSHDFRRAVFPGERCEVRGTCLTVAIPFKGDKTLWQIRPSRFTLSGYPEINVHDDRITFQVMFPDDAAEGARLKAEVDRQIQSLVTAVQDQRKDVAQHNERVGPVVRERLEAKRRKALSAVKAVASIGIPIKRRDSSPTYTIPTRRKPSPVNRPSAPSQPFAPEPTLDMAEYDHILGILRSMALVIERNPLSFASLDEEAIRDHFLLQLNGHYEGGATGETFNKSGKTDILIRQADRNVFIAECKFWRGPKGLQEALDQLLGYLTWRDCKCALLIFNRNRDTGAVAAKIHEVITTRPEYRKTVTQASDGTGRYVLVKTTEPGREIFVSTLLFDVPVSTHDGSSE